jgi:hypothetical protein
MNSRMLRNPADEPRVFVEWGRKCHTHKRHSNGLQTTGENISDHMRDGVT